MYPTLPVPLLRRCGRVSRACIDAGQAGNRRSISRTYQIMPHGPFTKTKMGRVEGVSKDPGVCGCALRLRRM